MSRTKDAGTAVFVTARKLGTLVYRMLRWGQQYVDEGQQAYEARFEAARLRAITETDRQVGYTLVEKAAANA